MAMAAGAIFRIAGGITGGIAADKRRKEYEDMMRALPTPDPLTEEGNYFNDLSHFYPQANRLSQQARSDELNQTLALRERALPGSTQALQDAMSSISPLLRGEAPQGVQNAYLRAGGANSVGHGFGGSQYDALNVGLFGARGAMGAIQTGMGLLPTLLGSLPNISAPTTMGLLQQLLNPQQRINLQMQLRQQQIGMNNTLSEMPTALDSWSSHLNESGAMLMGGGGASMGGGGGAAGGAGAQGAGGRPTSGWGAPGQSPAFTTVTDQYGQPTQKWTW